MMPLKSLGRGPPPIGAVSWNCRTPGVPHAWRAWHTFDGIELFLSLQRKQLGPVLDHREQLLGCWSSLKRRATGKSAFTMRSSLTKSVTVFMEIPTSVMISICQNAMV
jgi:hypothetical protein|eukprot:jgi/Chrpa1/18242/Chrysochromulina_OHIO_Genome00021242-RA